MRNFILILLVIVFSNAIHAQTLSPSTSNEYCPNTDYTFTFSISGNYGYVNVIVVAPVIRVSQANSPIYNQPANTTTFTFTIRFGDVAIDQSIRVQYATSSSVTNIPEQPFTFPKVKSISTDRLVSNLLPASPVTIAPCQTSTFTVSFTKTKFKNTTSGTEFSDIPDYQYSVPANWKVNGILSSGTANWITVLNASNVTIESDQTSGDGELIRVRAYNSCAPNLNPGPISGIPISRPKPPLTFTGSSVICSSQNFQAFNVPSWVTSLLWEVTPGSVATVVNPASNPATVQKQSDGFANIKLTISNPSCGSFSYTTTEILNNPEIVVGTPAITGSYLNPNFSGGVLQSGQSVCSGTIRVSVDEVQATTYTWQRVYGTAPFIDNGGYIDVTLAPNENVSFQITVCAGESDHLSPV